MEFTKEIEFNDEPSVNQELTLYYHGFLSHSPELTIVYGFSQTWQHTTETPMIKTENGFSIKIKLLNFDSFHFCFRDSNGQWDNNHNNNYITPILPEQPSEKFDLDQLIEEILEPILFQPEQTYTPIQVLSSPVDLGLEISKILSQISEETSSQNLTEYTTLDEILLGTVIEETPIELFENETSEEIQDTQETRLVPIEDPFMISPRKLSKFYLWKKQIKLSLYKLFVKIPKLIFGSEEP